MVIKLRLFLKLIILYCQKILDVIEHLISLDPKKVSEAYAEAGRECVDRGLEKDAINFYQKAILLNPEDENANFQLGRIYI